MRVYTTTMGFALLMGSTLASLQEQLEEISKTSMKMLSGTQGCLIGLNGRDVVSTIDHDAVCRFETNGTTCYVPARTGGDQESASWMFVRECKGTLIGQHKDNLADMVVAEPETQRVEAILATNPSIKTSVRRGLDGQETTTENVALLLLLVFGLFAGTAGLAALGGIC